ncbi:protease inhibitor I42 family protein [Streptomyces sp. RS10V-4]|uniref:protease inhibitor I42 family protein n=1 Tax=Streptomyces rhizoryzae TaxID=2932493 RepID=UPI002006B7DA|nr:protease inhibitor I42 family protein [Streptomyces rhizoryzae]MCK7625044.1 protease inhibitor I42 family protein [Streptomyces rhizoryzae]
MESGGITRHSRALVTALAVTALLIALYSVVSRLSGPEVYGPADTEIAVSAGDRFTVEVPDDPGDGFHWIIAAPRPDPAVLRPDGERAPDGSPGGAPPAAGTRWLDFRAGRPGRADLRLLRCRRCATGAAYEPGARALNFRVTVG